MAGNLAADRRPSAAWCRLMNAPADPLGNIGLPSKGDNRHANSAYSIKIGPPAKQLLDLKVQETYYHRIVERYMQFCAVDRKGDTLDKAFASLSLGGFDTERPSQPTKLPDTTESRHQAENVQELSTIMLAMRKLREAIVASSRTDSFAQQSYIFIIRATILTMHMESYHPALLHLLRKIHPVTGLSTPDIHEFVGYYILDLACRQDDLAAAYAVRSEYKYRDARIDRVLKALVHDNWVLFWAVGKLVDGYQRHLMGWADDGMRSHALKSLGRSYLSVEKDYVEKSANKEWSMLKEKENVGWQLEGERVTIRRVRRN